MKENFDVKLGDLVRIQYQRSSQTSYDRVGFINFITDSEISLLSCKESSNSLRGKSVIEKLVGLWQGIINSIAEPDNYRHVTVPYDSISRIKVLERNGQTE